VVRQGGGIEDCVRVLISGATGLVGTALRAALLAEGIEVARLVRPGASPQPGDIAWDPECAVVDAPALEGADAVVNLSGASIGERRWTKERKHVLRSSRIGSTHVLVDALKKLRQKPSAFLCASAVGYYGNRGDEILREASRPGNDFLAKLTRDWETEAAHAEINGMRTVMLRFGVILSAHGGALPKMLAPFKMGAGGRLGNGKQWMSWVALDDAVGVIRSAIRNTEWRGPINVVAPNPVQNSEFTRVLAATLHRPALFPAPAFALRFMLGEMAEALLLSSQRVRPEKLQASGYEFHFATLEPALRAILVA
jgi:uncharacterized protein